MNLPRCELDQRFHGPLMAFFIRRTKDYALAQDLTQETLVRVLSARQHNHIEAPESYVFAVATNLLRDWKRELARVRSLTFLPVDEAMAATRPYRRTALRIWRI